MKSIPPDPDDLADGRECLRLFREKRTLYAEMRTLNGARLAAVLDGASRFTEEAIIRRANRIRPLTPSPSYPNLTTLAQAVDALFQERAARQFPAPREFLFAFSCLTCHTERQFCTDGGAPDGVPRFISCPACIDTIHDAFAELPEPPRVAAPPEQQPSREEIDRLLGMTALGRDHLAKRADEARTQAARSGPGDYAPTRPRAPRGRRRKVTAETAPGMRDRIREAFQALASPGHDPTHEEIFDWLVKHSEDSTAFGRTDPKSFSRLFPALTPFVGAWPDAYR